MCHSVQILNANINLPCRPQRPGMSNGGGEGFRKGVQTFQRTNECTAVEEPFHTLLASLCMCMSFRGGGEHSNYNTLLLCFLPLEDYIRGNGSCSLRPVDNYEIFFISISLMTVVSRARRTEALQICSRFFVNLRHFFFHEPSRVLIIGWYLFADSRYFAEKWLKVVAWLEDCSNELIVSVRHSVHWKFRWNLVRKFRIQSRFEYIS